MKIAITGASGLIGSALTPSLRADGHEVVRLVRRTAAAPDEVSWDPVGGTVDLVGLSGADAVIHLAGAGVGDHRWTDSYKRQILDSRRMGTDTIARAVAALEPQPSVLVSASAMGYYGDTGDAAVDETGPKGRGFLADVVEQWEAAADPARAAGVRVVHPRTGLVVSADGGAWGRLLPLFRLGIGGRLGSGRQWWSFITLADEVSALKKLVDSDLTGPVNLTSPHPATNAEVTAAMGEVLHRPTLIPVPSFALKAVLGEFSSEVLGSARVLPGVLQSLGFPFAHPTIGEAIRFVA
jgi:uncharacterized protein